METKSLKGSIETVSDIYVRLAENLDAPENIKEALKGNTEKWKSGRKIARSAYMIPLCRKLCSKSEICAEKILVSLDAVVNALDDTMDTAKPTKREKWEREVTKTISMLLMFLELGKIADESVQKAVMERALGFIISLSQIPWIEKEFTEKIRESDVQEEEIENSVMCVKERARDINLFLDIVLMVSGVSGKQAENITKIVKNYRALEMFWKDLADIELDIENNSKTQTVILFEKHGKSERFRETLKRIAERIYKEIEMVDGSNEACLYMKNIAREKYEDSIKRINSL